MDDTLPPLLPAEAARLAILQQLAERHLTQAAAADLLGLTTRQVKRLLAAYRTSGPASVVSKKRGQPSNRHLHADLEAHALDLIRTRYADFGPTFAHEKLSEVHGLTLSVETGRQLMITAGVWGIPDRRTSRSFINCAPVAPALASWYRSMGRRTPGLKTAHQSVPYWSLLMMPPRTCWSCISRLPRRPAPISRRFATTWSAMANRSPSTVIGMAFFASISRGRSPATAKRNSGER